MFMELSAVMVSKLSRIFQSPTNDAFNRFLLRIKSASSPQKALQIYSLMRRKFPTDTFSIVVTLKACSSLRNLSIIQYLHSHVNKLGFIADVHVCTSLLSSYILISLEHARNLFEEMPERNTVSWNTMIDGLSKCGDVGRARLGFESMPIRDVVSWSSMISAYVNKRKYRTAFALFRDMMENGLEPDEVTAGAILSACAHMDSLGLLVGKSVHGYIAKNRWQLNLKLGTILVDMYGKGGSLTNAFTVFSLMQEKNVLTWTSLICGSARHGFYRVVLTLFDMMKNEGIKPNELTFTGILSACVHTGLVEEGQKYFEMIEEYGLETRIEHYGCMVNLFGKCGMIEEAYNVIKTMRIEPNVIVLTSFLSACKEHEQFVMAERVIEQALDMMKPHKDSGVYTLICDLYVMSERWDDLKRIRKLMINHNVRKDRGCNSIRS